MSDPHTQLREQIARIIDPVAYEDFPVGGPEPDHDWWDREQALRKADAIPSLLSSSREGIDCSSGGRVQTSPSGLTDAQHSAGLSPLRLICEHCGRSEEYDRSLDPTLPEWVATLSQSHCDADGCDTGDRHVETWLDAEGVARDPAECSAGSPAEGRAGNLPPDEPLPTAPHSQSEEGK